jgi:hypothetical protein
MGAWVYSASITERNHRNKVSIVFMKVDKDNFSFYQNFTDSVPLK